MLSSKIMGDFSLDCAASRCLKGPASQSEAVQIYSLQSMQMHDTLPDRHWVLAAQYQITLLQKHAEIQLLKGKIAVLCIHFAHLVVLLHQHWTTTPFH